MNKKEIPSKEIMILANGDLKMGSHSFHIAAMISLAFNKERFMQKYCGPRDAKNGNMQGRALLDYDPELVWSEVEKAMNLQLKTTSPTVIVEKAKRGRKKKED